MALMVIRFRKNIIPLNSGYTVLNEAAVNFSYGVSKATIWFFERQQNINFKDRDYINHSEQTLVARYVTKTGE